MSSAAATVAPLTAPTVEQIRAQHTQKVRVYNPTDETVTVPQYGDHYTFEPNSEVEIGPKYRFDMISDRNPKSASNGVAWDDPKAHPRDKTAKSRIEAESAQIASEICSAERMGPKGFCVLLGDPRDPERKLAARRKWIAWRLADATARHQALALRATNATPGFPPLIKPNESAALKWLDRYNRGEFNAYLSSVTEASHQEDLELLARLTPGLTIPEAPETTAPPATEAAVPEDQDAGAILLKKAKKAKIALTRAELEGLIEGDESVVEAVARKLAKRG
jgi:hypothetical protein